MSWTGFSVVLRPASHIISWRLSSDAASRSFKTPYLHNFVFGHAVYFYYANPDEVEGNECTRNQPLFCKKDAFQNMGFSRLKCQHKRKKIDPACF